MKSATLIQMEALCSAREYCVDDIRVKLNKKGIETAEVDNIVASLIKEGFIDENRYAYAFVNDKFRYNSWGKVKIAAQLRQKKISQNTINKALNSIDNEEYLEKLRQTIAIKNRLIKGNTPFEKRAKLLRFALSRGFETDLIYNLLDEK